MSNTVYIFIEKESVGSAKWLTVNKDGVRAALSDPLITVNWTIEKCLLVRSWTNGADLKQAMDHLAQRLDSGKFDYRVFLHPGTGALSDQDPRKIWQLPRFDAVRAALPAERWPRLWSVGGSQSQSFSKVVQDLVNEINPGTQNTKSQPTVSDWSNQWLALHEAWDQATDFFSIHPKLRKTVGGLYALSGQIEHGTPPGWAPLNAESLQKVAQAALEATNEILIGLHGEQDGKATAVRDELNKIVVKPLDASVWPGFVRAVNDLKS